MEYTELDDYSMPGGTVTAWEPTVEASEWQTDSRQLSYMHLEHARRAVRERDDWYSQWIGTAFRIQRPLDREAFSRTLLAWYRRHEAFRTSVRVHDAGNPQGDLTRITVAADAISVRERAFGSDLAPAEVSELVTEYFNTTVTPLAWPHCIAVTVETPGDDEGFLVVFAADHTVMDAYTQVFAIRELTALYLAEVTGDPHGLAAFGSYLDFSDAERRLGEQIDANNAAVSQWRNFFDDTTTAVQPEPIPRFPQFAVPADAPRTITAQRSPAEGFQTTLSHWLLDPAETKRFDAICKAAGSSMTAGIYTALSMTAAALTGSADLRFISPVHTRNAIEWGEAVGWFVGIIPVAVRPGRPLRFTDALTTVAATSAQYKDVGGAPFAPVAELIGGDVTPPGFVVSYIDLRHAEGSTEWEPRAARVLRSATRDADEVYFWINRIPTGVNVSSRFPAEGAPAVETFLSVFHAILKQIVTDGDCEYTYRTAELVAGGSPVVADR
ncbi:MULTISPECIES: condensation domain-containing protein [Gordonia]|uniref:Peptide synthase n=1 Tax=Gordonia alkanivorans CGMCC 6845 TaxID=1423140 RepID=W9DBG5_9ACTN|nr:MULTISPECIES: condensation domain-containing protein [Gordonia]ETA05732.1 peptide synthase [Gordonia alkanivorans CGMCC 6845]MDH3005746.1 condensation domain-containing protein [Gordonia alkanivorans]MDH3016039.1 condensation domain-containing protein [Gordonia alkanivorans]MDH3024412.1 condensation domain-containing protein [Gordonia alkanivorans]MDH3040879.1 condensation domain-containing protein [Gordonia alkanivorans]